METKISRGNKVSFLSLPLSLSLSLFSLSIEHLWAKTIDGLSMHLQIWTVSGSMLTSQLTIHMLKCIVRGHACCPVFLDSSFHSSFHLKSSQRLNEKKQCIANTIKKYNLATAALNRKGDPVEQGGRHLLEGGTLSVQCSRRLLIFDFKVRRSLRAALFRLNAIECCVFRKSAYLFPT